MTSPPAGQVEVSIAVVSETLADGERWFASAYFHGTHRGERIAGVFDYSYTPFRTRREATDDAMLRTVARLRRMLGEDAQISFAPARLDDPAGDANLSEAAL
jgi:hypothetical protein